MAGNIKVGGHTVFTHTGPSGAGTLSVQGQNGNVLLSDDGTAVSLGNNVRLPASGGIKDSSGNNILTESGGVVSAGPSLALGTTSNPLTKNIVMGSGYGLDFSAAAGSAAGSSSAVLDDYEEGTWTPVVTRATSNPSGTPTTNAQYVKIGDVVHFQAYIALNGFSGGSGQWKASLPFANTGIRLGTSKARVYMDGDTENRQFRIASNSSTIDLHIPSNDSSYTSNITYLIWEFSGTYKV